LNLKRYLAVFLLFFSVITCASIEAVEQIRNKGSRTLGNIARIWAENYQRLNSGVGITVIGSSSGAGIAFLINGSIEIVNSSQPLSKQEIKLAARRGKNPRAHIVGYDALALYVHKDNPLPSLSIPELAQIFAKGGKITRWSDLSVEVPTCKKQRIVLFGRHITSGAHNYFRRSVLGKEYYKVDVRPSLSPEEVLDQVAENPCAIGYGSHTYAHQHVKMVCVSKDQGGSCVKPNIETIVDKSFPIIRPLYMYTNGKPNAGIQAYLDWILSAEGQCIALKEGFAPVRSVTCP
jgi:phosphate transport system substrate-binding protein